MPTDMHPPHPLHSPTPQERALQMLPMLRSLTPDNPQTKAWLNLWLKDQPKGSAHIAGPHELPDIQKMIADETAQLNKRYGTHYPPPTFVLQKNQPGLEYSSKTDTIFINPRLISSIHDDPEALRALLGHELGHRWQRSDKDLLLFARLDWGSHAPQDLRDVRKLESQADQVGASLTSNQAMIRGLKKLETFIADTPDQLAIEYYKKEHHLNVTIASELYKSFATADKQAIIQAVNKLSPSDKAALLKSTITDTDIYTNANEQKLEHPSYQHRIAALNSSTETSASHAAKPHHTPRR